MFTGKGVFVGIAAVAALYAVVFVVQSFREMPSGGTSGVGTLVPALLRLLTSPGFWAAAVLLFFAVVFLTARLSRPSFIATVRSTG